MTSQSEWIALLLFSTLASEGAGLRQVWEIDLTTSISEKPGAKLRQPTVFAIRFSPNNQHLAVITEEFIAAGSQAANAHLLILQAKQGRVESQFQVERGIADSDNMTSWPSINWTASGDAVIAGAEAIRVSDQRACQQSWSDATVGSRLAFGANLFAAAESIARFLLSDFACEPVQHWKFKRDWVIEDISLERGLLCVIAPRSSPSTDPVTAEYARIRGEDHEVMVVDPLADKVIQRWPAGAVPLGDLRFAGGGNALCAGGRAERNGSQRFGCWEVGSGKAEIKTLQAGSPIGASSHSTRIVASDYRSAQGASDHGETLERRIVFDLRSGEELASWRPRLQWFDVGLRPARREWSAFAISPDGRFLAEGGDGRLGLYEIGGN